MLGDKALSFGESRSFLAKVMPLFSVSSTGFGHILRYFVVGIWHVCNEERFVVWILVVDGTVAKFGLVATVDSDLGLLEMVIVGGALALACVISSTFGFFAMGGALSSMITISSSLKQYKINM